MNAKHVLRFAFLFVLPLLITMTAVAQTRTVTGTVVDDSTKAPIAGVTIKVKDGPQTAITNDQGNFTLNAPANGAVIQYSHVNYEFGEVSVKLDGPMNISLKRVENSLDDVVVVGYGTQSRRDITGSVATVDLKKLTEMPVASVTEALRGQIPGLNVSGGSNRPGNMATLSIRQQFNWGKDGGSDLPLVVIDDVIQLDPQSGKSSLDRFNQLDLSEIESITVLRDAAAAIYGSRASQGAIIVKTKRGKTGPPRVSYNAKFQTNDAISHGKVMNARQYGEFANSFGRALGTWTADHFFSDAELAEMGTTNYDWLMNDWRSANAMQHSLDLSGGSERATYFTGASYFTQGANLGNQDFSRWTYRAGTDVKVLSGLKFGATIAASNTNSEKSFTKINFSDGFAVGGEQNDYSVLLHMPKYIPWVYNINGVDQYISPALGPNKLGNMSGNNSLSNWNYYAFLNNGSKTTDQQFNYNANFNLQYDLPFIKGLSFKLNYGISQASVKTEQNQFPITLVRDSLGNKAGQHLYNESTVWSAPLVNRSGARVSYLGTTSKNEQSNFFINYDRKFGDHNISAMASVERATTELEDRRMLYDNPNADIYNGTSVSAGSLNTGNSITYRYQGGTLSYLGRLNYNYKGKYLFQFVYRTDASTNFAPENYWGQFPGVSAGWVMSDEKFFKNNISWVNFLKIRASLANTGNNNVNPWKWLQLYTAATDKGFGFGSNGGIYTTGFTPGVTPNRALTWDKTLQRNFGLDLAFLNRRLSVTFDQYFNSTRDMLTDMSAAINSPISVGGAFAEQNFAGVNSWGSELSINWKDNIGDFSYSIGVNGGMNNYKTVKYFDLPFNYPSIASTRRAEGNYGIFPVYGFTTWKETSSGDGMLRTDADIDNYWNYLTNLASNSGIEGAAPNFLGITEKSGLRKGMLVYEDVAGNLDVAGKTIGGQNGRIMADEDYVKLKKSNRTYGLTTNISMGWKGISLLTQIATSWGGANYLDYIKQGTSSNNAMWSHPVYLTDMYDAESNPNGKSPNLAYFDSFGGTRSDFFLMPTFRMFVRSLSVGYTLPKSWVQSINLENARIYLSGQNLWDFYNPYPKKYRNMYDDPRVSYPTLRTWALGLSVGF
ncbi:SusC/RagA family TonB-linked outer membrane protein [Niabella yanshanensis]|uniref:SusC/RagA family TonB-linked outer membrane protein n=1 Tax=Niabella yanshanensis TaxID=577386 RepID=A0ABZ0W7U2_9BACT|nr:SusC/RagA family TonB-linked outer membrane protein [Niabella yanshanensis]WQD39261.1 SusC/RagA family TonB-linked outer membrane protein [Niabella yanshanensis]